MAALTKNVGRRITSADADVTSEVTITALHDNLSYTLEPRGSSASQDDVPPGSPPSTDNFKVGRVIMNLKLAWQGAGRAPGGPLARLKIKILDKDVARAKGQSFKVGYWDRSNRQWVVLKQSIPCVAGETEVDFAKLGDPAIAVGP
jgi:hypothetical protein